ncbi:MAG: hypothetical protein CVU00_15320 [Bacteroidetes bacterium HGW-Bacteroidetes-17]|jgi:GMP synthase (glutamine-hydrolysing)|nr:MAG: hypothetical protein CVU00_15320 [Bacteroidetes bacterium HGW-Bacteroidetes-17]
MLKPNILILDYSVNRAETAVIKSCLPKDANITSLFIDAEESFPDALIKEKFSHIIHSGSALSINDTAPFTEKAIKLIQDAKEKGIWQMGICFGHQLIGRAIVGKHAVCSSTNGFEVGWKEVAFTDKAMTLLGIRKTEKVWQHHFDEVIDLPAGSELLATNEHTKIQAYIHYELHLLATQFHPEFNKLSGNNYFLDDREFIEKHHFNVDEIIQHEPSFDTGKVFFKFFLTLNKE